MITDITLRKRGSFSNSAASRRVRRDFNQAFAGRDLAATLRAAARELEIAASKRGDLLQAARFAELSEVVRG
ncbi:hypothetical protein D3C75_1048240 [compost metagenome]|uniref:hypothetical protein n=1 Tax=Stenotrophomonas TaxID=40323 RepID=UPI000FBF1DBF|nr:hypothetical protein [Stenotrophomonas sp. SKA14]